MPKVIRGGQVVDTETGASDPPVDTTLSMLLSDKYRWLHVLLLLLLASVLLGGFGVLLLILAGVVFFVVRKATTTTDTDTTDTPGAGPRPTGGTIRGISDLPRPARGG